MAVAIGLSSLVVFDAAALRSMGIGGVITVASTLLFGLTVLPALLAMLGPRVNRLRVPLPSFLRLPRRMWKPRIGARATASGPGSPRASCAARSGSPCPVLALLLIAGTPVPPHPAVDRQNLEDLPPTPARTGFEMLLDEFPGGDTDPITAVADLGRHRPAGRHRRRSARKPGRRTWTRWPPWTA